MAMVKVLAAGLFMCSLLGFWVCSPMWKRFRETGEYGEANKLLFSVCFVATPAALVLFWAALASGEP